MVASDRSPVRWTAMLIVVAALVGVNAFLLHLGSWGPLKRVDGGGKAFYGFEDVTWVEPEGAAVAAGSATAFGTPGAAVAELRCTDRPRERGACRKWRCCGGLEARWSECKSTCGACGELAAAIASATALTIKAVPRLGACRDQGVDCAAAVRQGKCGSDKQAMLKECQAACGFCTEGGGAPVPGDCADDLSLCPYLAKEGHCSKGSGWMDTQCRQSCGACAHNGRDPSAAALEPPLECKDYDAACPEWSKSGACTSNPSFMHMRCRETCKACGAAAGHAAPLTRPRGPGYEVPHKPVAAAPPPPAGAAAATHPRADYGQTPPDAEPEPDDEWEQYALCGGSSSDLEERLECKVLSELAIQPCKDLDPACESWNKDGECENNPGFMASVCKGSCDACTTYFLDAPLELLSLGPPGNKAAERRRREADDDEKGEDDDDDEPGEGKEEGEEEEEENCTGAACRPLRVAMPVHAFGTAGLGAGTTAAVAEALRAGFTAIDTAEAREWYRQDLIAPALKQSKTDRSEAFIITKIHPRNHGEVPARRAVERMLRELGTKYIDLLLIHYPHCSAELGCTDPKDNKGAWWATWHLMEKLYNEGKARAIGASNFEFAEMEELLDNAEVKPAVLQARSDPLSANTALVNLCLERGVVFQAYSVLGTQWARQGEPNPVLTHPVIQSIAAEKDRTSVQVVLRWALQRGMAVVSRSGEPSHIAENFDTDTLELSEDEMNRINALDGTLTAYRRGEGQEEAAAPGGESAAAGGHGGAAPAKAAAGGGRGDVAAAMARAAMTHSGQAAGAPGGAAAGTGAHPHPAPGLPTPHSSGSSSGGSGAGVSSSHAPAAGAAGGGAGAGAGGGNEADSGGGADDDEKEEEEPEEEPEEEEPEDQDRDNRRR
ncbi:hypothetical protein Rsub_02968 [Raphidocelis subcapitata]|uniref:ShKT domain-containing protein n=1 Tax=Raphidocelis subcapitata TaxID=307507 RepID=A0A2V0NQ72_9CHLO|nr:hypothetical protein Rsub_02968 [Raphidocelis subcapitata]|eukprot:GBF89798.1 hypothetical protein Rsub_02968 [Raphidocelis subcapitata]